MIKSLFRSNLRLQECQEENHFANQKQSCFESKISLTNQKKRFECSPQLNDQLETRLRRQNFLCLFKIRLKNEVMFENEKCYKMTDRQGSVCSHWWVSFNSTNGFSEVAVAMRVGNRTKELLMSF